MKTMGLLAERRLRKDAIQRVVDSWDDEAARAHAIKALINAGATRAALQLDRRQRWLGRVTLASGLAAASLLLFALLGPRETYVLAVTIFSLICGTFLGLLPHWLYEHRPPFRWLPRRRYADESNEGAA